MPIFMNPIPTTPDVAVAEIKANLEARKFPAILSDEDYAQIADSALREMDRYAPVTRYVSFTTVSGVQDYRIFDAEDLVTLGVAARAVEVRDVIWNPNGDSMSLDLTAPDDPILITGNCFNRPSEMIMLRQKLDACVAQFGRQGWEVVGPAGSPDSVLKVFPVPKSAVTIVVEIGIQTSIDMISIGSRNYFLMWLEYFAADAIANIYASTAGVSLLNFADSREAMKYWQGKADRYYRKAVNIMSGVSGAAMRG